MIERHRVTGAIRGQSRVEFGTRFGSKATAILNFPSHFKLPFLEKKPGKSRDIYLQNMINSKLKSSSSGGFWKFFFFQLLFIAYSFAQQAGQDPSQSQEIPVAEILTSVFFILVGFLFTFYGRHLFKSVLFLAGFLFGAAITFRILAAVEPVNDQGISQWGNDREWIYFGSQIAGGVLLGFLVVAVWRVGLFLLGLIGGFFISMALFSLFADAVNNDETFRLIFVIILSLVMGFLALFFEHPIVIISTAFAGSYSFFYGVDGFAQLGFQDAVNSFFGDPINNAPKITNGGVYGMIAGMIVLGIIGAVVQFKLTAKDARNYRDRDNSTLPFRSRKIQHDQSLV